MRQQILVTPSEAAKLLSISPRSLWKLTFEVTPGIPCVKLGRLTRYPLEELEKHVMKLKTDRVGGYSAKDESTTENAIHQVRSSNDLKQANSDSHLLKSEV